MISIDTATQLSDGDLVSAVTRLAAEGRQRTADLIALLAVVEQRGLWAGAGYPSCFRFCVGRLRLSEEEAFYRIAAARVAMRVPGVLERLREGRLTLTTVAVLRKHLTEENQVRLLAAAEGRTKREVQALVAALAPQPDVAPSIRRLPPPKDGRQPGTADSCSAQASPPCSRLGTAVGGPPLLEGRASGAPGPVPLPEGRASAGPGLPLARDRAGEATPRPGGLADASGPRVAAPSPTPADIRPLAPARYSLRLTISEETRRKLQRAHDLLGHTVAPGDSAAVIDRALTLLVTQLERAKYAARPPHPAPSPRAARPSRQRAAQPAGPGAPEMSRAAPAPGSSRPATAGLAGATAAAVPSASVSGPSCQTADLASRGAPAPRSRYLPAAVRREVWLRDHGRCAFVARDGHLCGSTERLEFHHKVPFADGGEPTASNLEIRCAAHNAWDARCWFGEAVTRYRGARGEPLGAKEELTRAGPS